MTNYALPSVSVQPQKSVENELKTKTKERENKTTFYIFLLEKY